MKSLQVAALCLGAAAAAQAQSHTITLDAPNAPVNMGAVTAFGYYMSPYSGTVDGVTQRLNCVDFFHEVYMGDVWQANIVNLGQASQNPLLLQTTRDGSTPEFAHYGSLPAVLDIYRQMAWLSDQQPIDPGANNNTKKQTIAIQTAIWAIGNYGFMAAHPTFNADKAVGGFNNPGIVDIYDTGYWIATAATAALNPTLLATDYYYHFNVVTNVNYATLSPTDHGGQEFIYKNDTPAEHLITTTTPEPGTFFLLGSGLIGIAGVASRRRNQKRIDATNELAS